MKLSKSKKNLKIEGNKVISYTTHVGTIDFENKTLTVLGYWSMTTTKHLGIVSRELGLTQIKK